MALAAIVMVLTPGPNMVYLVSRSIAQGRVAGIVSLAGTGVGFLVYMTMANLGLAVVFVAVPWIYIGLKAAGVVYLAWLAFKTFRPGGMGLFEARPLARDSHGKLFRMGLLTNLLNPKAAVMYLAIIPQFIDPAHGSAIAQGFTLGAVQITISMVVNAAIVFAAGTVARFVATRPTWLTWQRRITGTLLAAVAVVLAREVPQAARP
jgi:threonine/homoserine/homoserine lactone efflux protein